MQLKKKVNRIMIRLIRIYLKHTTYNYTAFDYNIK